MMIMRGYRRPWATYILLLINIVVYAIEAVLSGNIFWIDINVLAQIGQLNYYVINYRWYWQLITAMFVHHNIIHLGFNLFWLYVLGIQFERSFGPNKLITVYLLSGLVGNILTVFLLPLIAVSGGASGAIFGIFGYLLLYGGVMGGNVRNMILYGIFIFLINISIATNIWAHLGGMLLGMVWGYYDAKKVLSYRYYYAVRRW